MLKLGLLAGGVGCIFSGLVVAVSFGFCPLPEMFFKAYGLVGLYLATLSWLAG